MGRGAAAAISPISTKGRRALDDLLASAQPHWSPGEYLLLQLVPVARADTRGICCGTSR